MNVPMATMRMKAPLKRIKLLRWVVILLSWVRPEVAARFGNWALAHMSLKCRVGCSPWMKLSLAEAGTFQPKKGS